MNLSQPAVSHQIKSLEEKIGEPLFLRGKDGVSLTRAGRTMYAHAVRILDLADELCLEIEENKESMRGRLVIGAATQSLNNPFPKLYRGFREKYKSVRLSFQSEKTPEAIAEKVRAGKIDVGVLGYISDLSGLNVLPFGEFRFLCVAGKTHPLAGKKRISARDLSESEWIMLEKSSRLRLWAEEALTEINVKAKKIIEINDGSLVRSLIAAGAGISILPTWGVFEDIREGRIVPLACENPDYKVEIICVWKHGRRAKPLKALITYLLEEKMQGISLTNRKKFSLTETKKWR